MSVILLCIITFMAGLVSGLLLYEHLEEHG
jgi:hypothetical protein